MINLFKITSFISVLIFLSNCKKDDSDTLTVSKETIEIESDGGKAYFELQTSAASWTIEYHAVWLSLSKSSGTENDAIIWIEVDTRALEDRADTLIINAGSASPTSVVVKQRKSQSLLFEVDKKSITVGAVKSSDSIVVTSDYPDWTSSVDNDWASINPSSGKAGETLVIVKVDDNYGTSDRTAKIELTADNTQKINITITQKAGYQKYNTDPIAPDATGMGSTATELANRIGLGWNIGNTLEAIGGENAWGNPNITEAYIKAVKQLGFNAIRLPCSWDQYADQSTARISQTWLNRVKEVVGYCVNNDIYVLLNVHWDGGWLENNCTTESKFAVNAKQRAYWEQIATSMRDFDEHLMFASANEPNAENATQMGVLLSYHQTFINAVRSTGGRNTYRVLVLQGSSEYITADAFPTDPATNRLMYEEHNYTPYQFTLMTEDASWGKMFYYWGEGHHSAIEPDRNPTWGEESEQDSYFQRIKKDFVDKGIPVIMGEYGAYRRTTPADLTTHNDAVDYWITYVTRKAVESGVKPFFWDTGGTIDRNTNTVTDQRTVDAIIAGTK